MIDRLTPNQQRILRLLQQGKHNGVICAEMNIGYATLRTSMTTIRKNMGGFPDDPVRSLRRIVQRLTWEELEATREEVRRLREEVKALRGEQ